jgi:hypothetical protein
MPSLILDDQRPESNPAGQRRRAHPTVGHRPGVMFLDQIPRHHCGQFHPAVFSGEFPAKGQVEIDEFRLMTSVHGSKRISSRASFLAAYQPTPCTSPLRCTHFTLLFLALELFQDALIVHPSKLSLGIDGRDTGLEL